MHVDAPAHFVENGATIDDLEMSRLIGPATVVDLREHSRSAITATVLQRALGDRSPEGRVILATGDAGDMFYTDRFYSDAAYLTGEAAEWLLAEGTTLVAMDCLGEDPDEPGAPVRETLLGADVPIVDYITNTRAIADRETVEFLCFPLSMPDFDAVPARVAARV